MTKAKAKERKVISEGNEVRQAVAQISSLPI